ncbi:MAG TPA: hypothetical protein VJK71_09470, partial [Gemmatimonadales bacterium]|nr:hypothetical protein [Gemmatimonadales bacterium]
GGRELANSLVLYRWKLAADTGATGAGISRVVIPITRVRGAKRWKGLHPSDLTIDPASGQYVLVASRERALIVLPPDGGAGQARPLPGGRRHEHAEGVAIARDGVLIVSDESGYRSAAITLYRWP